MKATVEQLIQISIFETLSTDALLLLQPHSQVKYYRRGEIIIHEGDRLLPKLHAVLSGKIVIKKISLSGKETVLRQLPSGEMFAAPAIFGNGIAPGTISTLEDSQILLVSKAVLLKAIKSTPEIALCILNCFNRRLQEMHQTVHGLVSEKAIVRLARLILYRLERDGVRQSKEGTYSITNLPHQQMARMVGITYEESVRLFSKDLSQIVRYERGGILTIENLSNLKAIAKEIGQF